MLYESWEAVGKLFNGNSLIMYEAKYKTKHGKGLKIVIPKQMLQRLPMVLTEVKAGNTSGRYLLANYKANYLFFVSIKRNY